MAKIVTTLTDRGQVSMPASLRKDMGLQPGQHLIWEKVSDHECRILIEGESKPLGAVAMLGFARKLRKKSRSTQAWMKELREGER